MLQLSQRGTPFLEVESLQAGIILLMIMYGDTNAATAITVTPTGGTLAGVPFTIKELFS